MTLQLRADLIVIGAGTSGCGFYWRLSQAGFRTIVMELYALFSRHPGTPEKDIINALNKHLCRCTAYETNLVGALLAQEWMYGGVSSWILGAVTTHWRVVHCNLDSRRLVILRSAATKDLYYGIQAISCTATEVLCSAAPCSE